MKSAVIGCLMQPLSEKFKKILFLAGLAVLSLGAAYYVAVCTEYAPWGFSDAATYLSAARNLANGTGLGVVQPDGTFAPLQTFAPFYSIVLALFAGLNIDLVAAARLLDILLFASLVGFSGWLFQSLCRSYLLALGFALLIAFSPALVIDYTSIMSDQLAISLGVPGFLLLLLSIRDDSPKWMLLAAALTGLSLLTRYAFVAFPLAGLLSLFFLSNKPMRQRLGGMFKFGLVSLTPMLVWVMLQVFSKSSIGSRHYSLDFSFSAKVGQFFTQAYAVMEGWLPFHTESLPTAKWIGPLLLAGLLLVVIIGFMLAAQRRKLDAADRSAWLLNSGLLHLILTYTVVLFVTYAVSTELISLDERMFSPMIPVMLGLLLSCALVIDRKTHPKLTLPLLGGIIVLLFVAYNYMPMRNHPSEVRTYPNGYTSPVWKELPILTGDVELPPERPLISNAPDILLFYLNRSAFYLSREAESSGTTLSVNDPTKLAARMKQDCALLVLFEANAAELYEKYPYAITNQDILNLQDVFATTYQSENGMILIEEGCQ